MPEAGHEYITLRPAKNDGLRDVRAIGDITMELMQGYVKEEGTTGVDDPSRWSSDVLDFLSRTTSAASVKDLMKVSQFCSFYSLVLLLILLSSMRWYGFRGKRKLSSQ